MFGAPKQIATGFASWLCYCTDVAQYRSTKLCRIFGCLLSWYTIYIHFCGSCPLTEFLPGAKFTLHPSRAFSYIGSITAWHSSNRRQPNCNVRQRAPPIFSRTAITLGINPHSSYSVADADIIFLPCGFFPSSIFYLFFIPP